jgi:preprotein translocase subunit YajC
VVTAGGIFGRVARLETDEVELEIASKTKIRVLRSQVVQHAPKATLEVKD